MGRAFMPRARSRWRAGVGGLLERRRWEIEGLKVKEIGGGMGETREWEGFFEIPAQAGGFL